MVNGSLFWLNDRIKADLYRNKKELECDMFVLRQCSYDVFPLKFGCSMKFLGHICLPFNNSVYFFFASFCCSFILMALYINKQKKICFNVFAQLHCFTLFSWFKFGQNTCILGNVLSVHHSSFFLVLLFLLSLLLLLIDLNWSTHYNKEAIN